MLGPAVLMLALAMPASAQSSSGSSASSVSASDIQRLQDQVYDASNDVSRLRSRDSALADRLQSQLDDVRDEVIYLKVKMRKEGSVNEADYSDVRSRVQDIRSQARGDNASRSSSGSGSTWSTNSGAGSGSGSGSGYGSGSTNGTSRDNGQTQTTRRGEIPSGQELDVRLDRELTSDTAQVEDRFTATTVADLYQGNEVLIPAGSTVRGVVSTVQKATRTQRKGSLTVAFDQISVRGRTYPMHGTVTQALESEGIKGEVGKIGAGSAVGAIIGGIIGGGKGALLGVLIGGGGTIAATEGKDVTLAPGTILRVRLDDPLTVR
jgi:TolA-binding protein